MARFASVVVFVVFVVLVLFIIFVNATSNNNFTLSNGVISGRQSLNIMQNVQKEKSIILQYQSLMEKRSKNNRDIKNADEFWKKRTKIADLEVKTLFGNSLPLNEDELLVNEFILSRKFDEYANEVFLPSRHFFETKKLIEQSDIFEIIKKIPKGANLYGSFLSSVDFDFMYELTFDDNLHFRFADKLDFKFSKTQPEPGWRSLAYLRNQTVYPNYVEDLNDAIKESLTLITANPLQMDQVATKDKFYEVSQVRASLIKYKSNFLKTLRRILEILHEDNIMYAELHFDFSQLYDLDGKTYNPFSILRLAKVVIDDFTRAHRGFIGLRFIYVPNYSLNITNIKDTREIAVGLWKANPNLIAGFGIVTNKEPLSDLLEELLKFPKDMRFNLITDFNYNWGVASDYNILDAMVLSAASISEASGITKHPFILDELRNQDIPIKFSPILAQILRYVKDIRMHPLSSLVASNYPAVVGNAGAGYADATGLRYDWYLFYMGMTPKFCDIRCLKQLAINSWLYSGLAYEEKKRHIAAWQEKWDDFIEDIIIDLDLKKKIK